MVDPSSRENTPGSPSTCYQDPSAPAAPRHSGSESVSMIPSRAKGFGV